MSEKVFAACRALIGDRLDELADGCPENDLELVVAYCLKKLEADKRRSHAAKKAAQVRAQDREDGSYAIDRMIQEHMKQECEKVAHLPISQRPTKAELCERLAVRWNYSASKIQKATPGIRP